jgi:hypothetical protein
MAPWQIIGMAGTSPAVTKWEQPRVLPCYLTNDYVVGAASHYGTKS